MLNEIYTDFQKVDFQKTSTKTKKECDDNFLRIKKIITEQKEKKSIFPTKRLRKSTNYDNSDYLYPLRKDGGFR